MNRDVGTAHIYSTISAGDSGVVDVAWYSATTADPEISPDGRQRIWYAGKRAGNGLQDTNWCTR